VRSLGAGRVAGRDGLVRDRARSAARCACAPASVPRFWRPNPMYSWESMHGIQSAPGARPALRRNQDGPVRESQVWAWRQSRARSIHESVDLVLCSCCRSKALSTMNTACRRVRRTYARRRHPDDGRPLERAPCLQYGRKRPGRGLAAGEPRGEVARLAGDFASNGALARRTSARGSNSSRRWRALRRGIFSEALARHAPGLDVQLIDRQSQTAADRGRCGPGGLRDGESGSGPVQAAHGGRVPFRAMTA